MSIYNQILIHKYQLKNMIHDIKAPKVKEADIRYKADLIDGLKEDFAEVFREKVVFKIYPYQDVVEFINASVEKSINEINALRTNKPLSNPEELYIEEN